jgi:hypothetical protein
MFRKNDDHLQLPLFSGLNQLPEKLQQLLERSWAGTFYQQFFLRIDEAIFAPLFSDEPSRPNIPINVLVSLEAMKAGFGWSDQEMYENFCFDIQVRYAVGYRDLGAGHFELRTVYNFRRRLAEHMQQTGENLIEQAFEQMTDQQVEAFALHTSQQRMDSSQIASNIREVSRLQLLVEVVQRVQRHLVQEDQERLAAEFAPYVKGSSGQYVYRLKGTEAHSEHLQAIGDLMHWLIEELAERYAEEPAYQMLVRVFHEHFVVEEAGLRAKQGQELRADSLQSPDDWEASFRRKRGEEHIGYAVNLAETCHEQNAFQLILKVQTESNTTDDAAMLVEALPNLKARTDLDQMNTDGGYNSPEVDREMRQAQVELIQTAIRGLQPSGDQFNLAHCELEVDAATGVPLRITAPNGQQAEVEAGRKPGRYIARFGVAADPDADQEPGPPPAPDEAKAAPSDQDQRESPDEQAAEPAGAELALGSSSGQTPTSTSQGAPLTASVGELATDSRPDDPPAPDPRLAAVKPPAVYYFDQAQVELALRRQRSARARQSGKNPRAAVEATVGAVKRPFGNDQVPVRGAFRVGMMMIGSAIMVNMRRIWRYQTAKRKKEADKDGQVVAAKSFFAPCIEVVLRLCRAIFSPDPACDQVFS